MACKCDLNDKLEAERLVFFSSAPAEKPLPLGPCARQHFEPKPCKKAHLDLDAQADRDKLYFNAGRYSAGARDRVAVEANNKLFEEA
jgi:hypothetical protein